MKQGVLFLCFLFFVCKLFASEPPKQEVRAVWLTTAYGLDWPKKAAKTEADTKAQQQALCDILDRLQAAHINMVFIQARIRGDVIYRSVIEPYSNILTGEYGKAPSYDPLQFIIKECHKRGMECHAWLVTFPVGTPAVIRNQGNRSVVKRHPELCKLHEKQWYLDPGLPETRKYLLTLVKEVVSVYDIDGIHFDYIRYPEKAETFPDKAVYQKYGKGKTLGEWRRDNITTLVESIYDTVKALKPWVQVSTAPIGKYSRIPEMPNAGWTAYDVVYQDPKAWIEKDKHDMIVPMMYFLDNDFYPFVTNWVENCHQRLIVPGLGVYKMDKKEAGWPVKNIIDQIDFLRKQQVDGIAFYRCDYLLDNKYGLYEALKEKYFKYPALLPPLDWVCDTIPQAPEDVLVTREDNQLTLSWDTCGTQKEVYYTVYYAEADTVDTNYATAILATHLRDNKLTVPVDTTAERGLSFTVRTSNRYHVESNPSRPTYYYLSPYVK